MQRCAEIISLMKSSLHFAHSFRRPTCLHSDFVKASCFSIDMQKNVPSYLNSFMKGCADMKTSNTEQNYSSAKSSLAHLPEQRLLMYLGWMAESCSDQLQGRWQLYLPLFLKASSVQQFCEAVLASTWWWLSKWMVFVLIWGQHCISINGNKGT